MRIRKEFLVFLFAIILGILPAFCYAQDEPQLTEEQKKEFLAKAKVITFKQLGQGITRSYLLTLSDGKITHDAHFQSINERRTKKELERGTEYNFVDSYLYNIAAYEIAKLLDLDAMLPVAVPRDWEGKTGAAAWWIPSMMNIGEKEKKKLNPPDIDAWNNAMHKIRVFTELIYDTDRSNPGNILIGHNWELYMIDFTRAFRLYHELRNKKNLVRCSRALLKKLKDLNAAALSARCVKYLNELEMEGLMKRRDKIVSHFENLIREKGEEAILY